MPVAPNPAALAVQYPSGDLLDEEDSQDLSKSPPESEEEDDDDFRIIGEYVRINRSRERFKCEFRNCFILINGKEYVAKLLHADLKY